MVYHLWVYDKERKNLSLYMKDSGPRTWANHSGPRAWAERQMEWGTFRGFQCECVTPCPEPPKYIAKYKRV